MAYLSMVNNSNTAKNRLLRLAKERGVEVKKNNIAKAKPLAQICGNIKVTSPIEARQLFCR